jgi:hypothetical protein
MEYVWFVEFDFASDGQLLRCRVSPHFPFRGSSITGNVLCALAGLEMCSTLAELLDSSPTAGFSLLSRYTDTLASIHALPITPLQLLQADGQVLDLSQAQILAQGQHSLVLLSSPASGSVVKISRASLVDRERRIHSLVDGASPHLRKMVAGSGGYGVVQGAGDGLAFLLLDGVGTPFAASHVSSDAALASLWQQAAHGLDAMHAKRVLHRDVKPSNMILLHGALLLNDFDIACELHAERELEQLQVGTQDFHSPRLADKWRTRDDWLGLALAFLSLRMPFPFADKQAALEQALQLGWVPAGMKQRIQDCYK